MFYIILPISPVVLKIKKLDEKYVLRKVCKANNSIRTKKTSP